MPDGYVEVALTGGRTAKVDAADAHLVSDSAWHPAANAYTTYATRPTRRPDGTWRTEYMHRVILGASYVDHKNGDGLDNRRSNLRPATRSQNMANIMREPSSTGYRGVEHFARRGKWRAYINADSQTYRLGYYDTPEEAASARDEAARRLHGEFAVLNFPREGERGVRKEGS